MSLLVENIEGDSSSVLLGGKMAQWERGLATKHGDLSSTPTSHLAEEKN